MIHLKCQDLFSLEKKKCLGFFFFFFVFFFFAAAVVIGTVRINLNCTEGSARLYINHKQNL